MKEIKRMLAVYKQIDRGQRKGALATVVYVGGSAYRYPRARMLVTDDDRWEGAISDGCLEYELKNGSVRVFMERIELVICAIRAEAG